MYDLTRFLVILMLFVAGFTLHVTSIFQVCLRDFVRFSSLLAGLPTGGRREPGVDAVVIARADARDALLLVIRPGRTGQHAPSAFGAGVCQDNFEVVVRHLHDGHLDRESSLASSAHPIPQSSLI